jgi:uncharacterized protein (DUF305 family)
MEHEKQHQSSMQHAHYGRLALMIGLSFIAMYMLMYAMVDSLENVFNSFNQFYMAGLMTAAMLVIELGLMWGMYKNKKLNAALLVIGLVALVGFWTLIRLQTAISDRQFLKSMIPHHAGAILMCEQADVRDQRILHLCKEILSSQRAEIAQMKSLLEE